MLNWIAAVAAAAFLMYVSAEDQAEFDAMVNARRRGEV